LDWVYRNISSRGGNPDRIYLAGHSAGATAAGLVAFRTDWLAEQGLPEDLVQGVVLISGGYINRREGEEVNKASKYFVPDLSQAIAHLPPHSIIVTAEHDLPQCQPGAEALVVALKRKGASHEFISRVPGRDHFFVGHELADGGSIFAATREMMSLR
jgi:acetyl esterase/lipase